MATASEGLFLMEFGQNPSNGYEELTNSGDNTIFFSGLSFASQKWSNANGSEPDIVIDGVVNGGAVTPDNTTNDSINIAAALYNLGGVADKQIVSSAGVVIDRPATDTHLRSVVTITAAGAFAVIQGAEGTSFSAVRGDAGGPPYVPVGDIQIAQVSYSSQTPAAVGDAEILQIAGSSMEVPTFPSFDKTGIYRSGGIIFNDPLDPIHTGDVVKGVFVQYFTPVMNEVPLGKDLVPPAENVTINSDQRYRATIGTSSKSLTAGTVNVFLDDGHTDPVLGADGDIRWVEFYSNAYKTPHIEGQATIGVGLTYTVESSINADITFGAATKWLQKAS